MKALQYLVSVSTAVRCFKPVWPLFPIEVHADFESIAIQDKYAAINLPCFGTGLEVDINAMNVRFNVNEKDAFVNRLWGFRSETITIDQNSRRPQPVAGNGMPVNFQRREIPAAFQISQLLNVPCKSGPTCKASSSSDNGLCIRQSQICADKFLVGKIMQCRKELAEGVQREAFAATETGEKFFRLSSEKIEIGTMDLIVRHE